MLENGIERVKITDFGLARAVDDVALTQAGLLAGTPQYMAPEQARGTRVDHRADLFSLGSVLYTMCMGRPPFRGNTAVDVIRRVCDDTPRPVQEANPEIPRWLIEIIEQLHAKDPARRLHPASRVAELLGGHLARVQQPGADSWDPAPAGAGITGRETSGDRPPRRRWLVVVALLVILAVAAGVAELTGVTRFRSLFVGEVANPRQATRESVPQEPAPQEPASQEPVPQPEKGFVVGGPSGRQRVYPTVAEAVAAANAGDTIEIRLDGPISGRPVRIDKPLTIVAAEGYRPLFELTPGQRPCLDAEATLVLEGIRFRFDSERPKPPESTPRLRPQLQQGLIVSRDAPLYMANCCFVIKPPSQRATKMCVTAIASSICEVRNCLFLTGEGSGLHWDCPGGGRLTVHNSVYSGLTAIGAHSNVGEMASISLTQNTFCGMGTMLLTARSEEESKVFEVTAEDNLFEVRSVMIHPRKITEKLSQLIGWRDRRNLFAVGAGFVESRPADPLGPIAGNLEEWDRLWEQSDTESRETTAVLSLEQRLKTRNVRNQLVPGVFRVKGQRSGADVDLVGPGTSYERWRKTADYRQWHEKTEQAMIDRP